MKLQAAGNLAGMWRVCGVDDVGIGGAGGGCGGAA
jgi:hypothetical protein